MADENNSAPEAPVAAKTLILKHPSWSTLDVPNEDGQSFGDEGALVDISVDPYLTLLERGQIVVAPEPAPAKSGK